MSEVKKVPMASVSVDGEEGMEVLVWTFSNGGSQSIVVSKLRDDVRHAAMLHGLKQTISDAYSSAKGDAGLAEGLAAGRMQTLLDGTWSARGGNGQGAADLVEAVVRATGKAKALVEEKLGGMDKEGKKALMKNPAVKAKLAEILAERLAKVAGEGMELDSLFDAEEGEV